MLVDRMKEDDRSLLTLSIGIKHQRRHLQHKPTRHKAITLTPHPPGLLSRSKRPLLLAHPIPHRPKLPLLHLILLHPHLPMYPKNENLGPRNPGPLFECHRPLLHIRSLQHLLGHRDAQCTHLPRLEPADVDPPQSRHFFHLLHWRTVSSFSTPDRVPTQTYTQFKGPVSPASSASLPSSSSHTPKTTPTSKRNAQCGRTYPLSYSTLIFPFLPPPIPPPFPFTPPPLLTYPSYKTIQQKTN